LAAVASQFSFATDSPQYFHGAYWCHAHESETACGLARGNDANPDRPGALAVQREIAPQIS
jgi:hypothetical protein